MSKSVSSVIKSLNDTIFQTVKNYNPNLIILGHSFEINVQTLEQIKSFDKKIRALEERLESVTNWSKIVRKVNFKKNLLEFNINKR